MSAILPPTILVLALPADNLGVTLLYIFTVAGCGSLIDIDEILCVGDTEFDKVPT